MTLSPTPDGWHEPADDVAAKIADAANTGEYGPCVDCGLPSYRTLGTTALCYRCHTRSITTLMAGGATPDELVEEWGRAANWPSTPADIELVELMASWQIGDVADAIANGLTTPHPEILTYTGGGGALFYRSKVNGLHGDSGIGKSWTFLIACKQEMEAGNNVLILDYESTLAEIIMRLRSLMVCDDVLIKHLRHITPHVEAAPEIIVWLCAYVVEHAITLVGIDSLGEAFGIEGINEDKDVEVGPWLRRVARPLAEAGPAIVTIDHGTKAADNPLHPSGSKRKRAAITGASYLVTTTNPPTQEKAGKLQLTCAKDRHGTYARGKLVAVIELEPHPDGGLGAKVWPPMPSDEKGADIGIMLCARDAVSVVKKEGRPLSLRSIVGMIKIKARDETKRAAVELAVARGNLLLEKGSRGAHLHSYVFDFDMNQGDGGAF